MTTATKETRQQKRAKVRAEEKAKEVDTSTLAYKESVFQGLVTVQQLVNTRPLSRREQDRIETIRGGLGVALGNLVEHAQHMELDLKTAAIKEEIEIYKNGLPDEQA